MVRKLVNIICWHQSEILYDIYQKDVSDKLLKYDACIEGVLQITPNVNWVQFDSRIQTAGITSLWSGGIFGKLIVVSLVRKFLASYVFRRFITTLTGARCRSCTGPVETSLYLHALFVFSRPFYHCSVIYVQVSQVVSSLKNLRPDISSLSHLPILCYIPRQYHSLFVSQG